MPLLPYNRFLWGINLRHHLKKYLISSVVRWNATV